MEKKMNAIRSIRSVGVTMVAILAAGVLLGAPLGCHREGDEVALAGPAEKTGRDMDRAGEEVGGQLTEAAERAGVGMRNAAQQVGDGVERAAEGASEDLDDTIRIVGRRVERAGEEIQESTDD